VNWAADGASAADAGTAGDAGAAEAAPAIALEETAGPGRRLLRNSAALTAGQLVARVMSTVAALVVARTLGPSLLGVVALAQTLAAFFGGLGDAGLTVIVYREIVLAPKNMWRLVIDTTVLQVALAFVLAGVLVLIAVFVPMPAGSARVLLLFAPYLLTEALGIEYALRAFEHMVLVAAIRIALQFVTSFSMIALVVATHDPIWVPISLWVGQLTGDVMIWWFLRARHPFERSRPRLTSAVTLLKAGAPLLISAVLINFWALASTVTLASLRSSRALGLYSAPFSLIFTAWVMSEVAVGGMFPEFVRRYRDDHVGFAALLDTVVRLTSRLTLPIAAFLMVGAEPLVRLLYGDRFAASGPLLQILAPIIPLGWFTSYVSYGLIAAGEGRAYAKGLAYGVAFATVAYPIWTGAFGATGTAIVSTLTVTIFALALTVYARIRIGVWPVPAVLREWDYLVVPLVVLVAFRAWLTFDTVLVPLLAAGIAVGAVELVRGFPTARQLSGLRRLSSAPTGSPLPGS
jgi:PST family polysaccharide transporter